MMEGPVDAGLRKLATCLLVAMLVLLPALLPAKERRGAEVTIAWKSGLQVSGELIAVRQDSLLLVNRVGQDVSVKLAEISSVTVLRKAHGGTGFLVGFLAGAAAGAALGYGRNKGDPSDQHLAALGLGVLFGALGGLVGAGIGTAAGRDITIVFKGLSEAEVQKAAARLRGMARMKTVQ